MARIILSGHDRPVPYRYDELTSGERLRREKEKAAPLSPEKRPWFILREPNPFYFELLASEVVDDSRRVAEVVLVIRQRERIGVAGQDPIDFYWPDRKILGDFHVKAAAECHGEGVLSSTDNVPPNPIKCTGHVSVRVAVRTSEEQLTEDI